VRLQPGVFIVFLPFTLSFSVGKALTRDRLFAAHSKSVYSSEIPTEYPSSAWKVIRKQSIFLDKILKLFILRCISRDRRHTGARHTCEAEECLEFF